MNDDDFIEDNMGKNADLILKYMPPFGQYIYYDKRILKSHYKLSSELISDSQIIKSQETIRNLEIKDKNKWSALNHLINTGFAIARNDLFKEDEEIWYFELSEYGRKAKSLGSINAFDLEELKKANEEKEAKEREKIFFFLAQRTYWVNVFLLLSTGIAAVYYSIEIWKWFFESAIPSNIK
jgi:hypothetical protein